MTHGASREREAEEQCCTHLKCSAGIVHKGILLTVSLPRGPERSSMYVLLGTKQSITPAPSSKRSTATGAAPPALQRYQLLAEPQH